MSEMEAELTDTETGRCFGCGQLFSTEEELSTHVMDVHGDESA
jgi:hypothetical protein